ncbi:MAG: HAD-IIA family hydrolase [Acidimicrobiia bacterium]
MTAGTVICDLDGVVYIEDEAVPGAGKALAALHSAGYLLLFATNNSSRTVEQVSERISRLTGYQPDADQIVGSAEAAARMLVPERPPTLVVGGAGIAEALGLYGIPATRDPAAAGAVVMGLRMDLAYQELKDATLAVRNGARFIATNGDLTFPTPEGLVPGAGAVVAAVEAATGVQAEVAGKPHAPIRALITERLAPGPVWVVGDRAETDLAMARAEGWTSVLVLSGVTANPRDIPDDLAPDLVATSLTELAEDLTG